MVGGGGLAYLYDEYNGDTIECLFVFIVVDTQTKDAADKSHMHYSKMVTNKKLFERCHCTAVCMFSQ